MKQHSFFDSLHLPFPIRASILFKLLLTLMGPAVSIAQPTSYCYPALSYQEKSLPVAPKCMDYTITKEVGSLTLGNNATATDAFPGVSDLTNWNLLVKGTFTLDKSMNFSQCRVFFDPDANMVTAGNVNLVALESIFGPCGENTWGGITINSSAAIQFQTCTIWGAINGLIFRIGYRSSQSHLIGNTFYQNGNGILCNDVGATLTFTDFYKNHFLGAGVLPGTTIQPSTGIKVVNCNAFIGTVFAYDVHDPLNGHYALWSNQFTNFIFGIESTNAKVRITNCGFYEMRPSLDPMGIPTGCGIRADNCNLFATAGAFAGSTIGYCDFENCAFAGINATNSHTHINLARFRGAQLYGITSTKTNTRFQRVSRCKVTLSEPSNKAGISIERPGNIGTPTVWITLDSIDIINPNNTATLSGIQVLCPNISTGNQAKIDNNQISLSGNTSVSFGIHISGKSTNNFRVLQNHCNATINAGLNYGIFLNECSGIGHQVNDNNSEGFYDCNFHSQYSRNVSYCNNICDQGGNGFHFQGDNLGTVWSKTHLGHHNKGLFIEDVPNSLGKIGPQTRKGNMWLEDDSQYLDKAAKCNGDASQSLFKLEEENNKVVFPTKTQPASGWFKFEGGNLEYCTSTGGILHDFDHQYAIGALPAGYLSAPEGWDISRGVIKTLLQNPSVMAGDAPLQYYYNQNLNSTAGRFAQAEVQLASNPYLNTTQQSQLASLLTQQETLADEITALMQSSTKPSITNGFYSSTNLTLDTKVQQWVSVSANMATILDNTSQVSNFQSHLGNVLTSLQNIVVSLPYEQAWKTIKIREVKDMMGITPSTSESTDMVNIAYGNQSIYGAAVRQAWQYMPECERLALIVPIENVSAREIVRDAIDSPENNDKLHLQPNPASDEVQVMLPRAMSGQWNLINLTGNIVRNGVCQGTESSIILEISNLSNGIYFYILCPQQGAPLVQKLIISR